MKFKYDWSCNPEVYELLVRLYNGSLQKLIEYNYINNYASEFIEDVEDFLFGMKQLFPNYFRRVVDKLEELKGISFASMKEDIGKFVQKRENYILIDPVTVVDYILCINPTNRKKISVFQGLASIVFDFKSDKTLEFIDKCSWSIEHKSFEDINKNKQFINSGWDLLEEALSQILAQKVYRFLVTDNNVRDDYESSDNQIVIDTAYWEFTNDITTYSDLMIRFGITISGISIMSECSKEVIICRLIKNALRGNFAELAIKDYQKRGQESQLFHILYDMGELYQNRILGYQTKLVNDSYTQSIYNNLLVALSKLIVFDESGERNDDFLNEEGLVREDDCKVRALVNIIDKPTFGNETK